MLGGCCTLIGTSTNLLVNDMASVAGQPRFGMFEITPVGLAVALAGGLYLLLFSGRLMGARCAGRSDAEREPARRCASRAWPARNSAASTQLLFERPSFSRSRRGSSLAVFVGVVAAAAFNLAPIAACAFAGAVLLILLRVITADEAYRGLRPEILMLIAGMVVLGIALEETGLADAATDALIGSLTGVPPAHRADRPLWRDAVPDRIPVERHRRRAVHAGRGRAGRKRWESARGRSWWR